MSKHYAKWYRNNNKIMNDDEKEKYRLYKNNKQTCIRLANGKCYCTICNEEIDLNSNDEEIDLNSNDNESGIYNNVDVFDNDEFIHCCSNCLDCHERDCAYYCDQCKEYHQGGCNDLDLAYVPCPKCKECQQISTYSREHKCENCNQIFVRDMVWDNDGFSMITKRVKDVKKYC